MTLREIAEREGVTPASVFVMLRKAGVEIRPPGRRPGPASPTYVELAARLRAKGLSLAEIGARVGRSGEAVRLALLKVGASGGKEDRGADGALNRQVDAGLATSKSRPRHAGRQRPLRTTCTGS